MSINTYLDKYLFVFLIIVYSKYVVYNWYKAKLDVKYQFHKNFIPHLKAPTACQFGPDINQVFPVWSQFVHLTELNNNIYYIYSSVVHLRIWEVSVHDNGLKYGQLTGLMQILSKCPGYTDYCNNQHEAINLKVVPSLTKKNEFSEEFLLYYPLLKFFSEI